MIDVYKSVLVAFLLSPDVGLTFVPPEQDCEINAQGECIPIEDDEDDWIIVPPVPPGEEDSKR